MSANELRVKRLLLVTDDESVFIEASNYFAALDFPVDRTRSFTTAGVLLAHLPYAAIVVHLGRTSFDSLEQFEPIAAILRRAQGAPVIVLTARNLPADADLALRKDVNIYLGRETPLKDVAQAVKFLLGQANKRIFVELNAQSA